VANFARCRSGRRSTTTRACVHDSSTCEPQCTEDTAIDLGSNSNVVTVRNNACVRVRDRYPSWWGRRTMQLMSWSGGTYPVPFTMIPVMPTTSADAVLGDEFDRRLADDALEGPREVGLVEVPEMCRNGGDRLTRRGE
jgi:hypothetical protein